VLNAVTGLLIVWLGWLLLSAPVFSYDGQQRSCKPIVGPVGAYHSAGDYDTSAPPEDPIQFLGRSTEPIDFNFYRLASIISAARHEAAENHVSEMVIAGCQDARANRQTEANALMLAIAFVAIFRLHRTPYVKSPAERKPPHYEDPPSRSDERSGDEQQ
jgi:hypothetical protein